jgi:pyrroline-5-carboxylate reductase
MTNLAIKFGSSVTAYASNDVGTPYRNNIRQLLEGLGVLIEMPEKDFDIFTAIFGSGPAFLLKLLDASVLCQNRRDNLCPVLF